MNSKLVFSVVVFLCFNIMAMPSDVSPTQDKFAPSKIRLAKVIDEGSATNPTITLVKIDSGGSTDIGAMMCPNSLYLGIHLDGEEHNIDGNYPVSSCVDKIESTKYDVAEKTIRVTVSSKNDHLKPRKDTFTILMSEVLDEVAKVQKEGVGSNEDAPEDYQLKSTIGIQFSYE